MADKWNPNNLPHSTYIWLPLTVEDNTPTIQWYSSWDLSIMDQTTGVIENKNFHPKEFSLSQNYPNPFNPTTNISYSIPQQSFVSIKVYNITGQEVAVLANGVQTEGHHQATFDAKNLASGIYIVRMNAGSFSSTIKMNLLK